MLGWFLIVEVPNWVALALIVVGALAGYQVGRIVEFRKWTRPLRDAPPALSSPPIYVKNSGLKDVTITGCRFVSSPSEEH